jgi:imidazolonepropionase-like amidohydrolase
VKRIEAGVLIPGRGRPIQDGCVVLENAEILFAGPRASAPETPDAQLVRVPAVMPGLWDCHTHFAGALNSDTLQRLTDPSPLEAMRVVGDARLALDAGFTSVREVGGYGIFLARAVEEGSVVGPTVYAAGAGLSPTGGHFDVHMIPTSWVCDLHQRVGLEGGLCDGVPECLRAVRLQLRAGASLIKVCASGGVMSQVDNPIHQQFSDEELRAIVEEAGRAERIVAAHCHGKPGIMAALRAGCRTIEHGTYLDEEAADAMRECDAILVPTRLIVEELLAHGKDGGIPDYAYAKLTAIAEQHADAISLAHERGVRIALGTDIGFSGRSIAGWGMNGAELANLVRMGLSPLAAIEAATATAPLTLGAQAPTSGMLAAGYDADVIALCADPSDDVSILADPANVTHVWKAGALVKSPAA